MMSRAPHTLVVRGFAAPTRLFITVALALVAVPGAVDGHEPDGLAASHPAVRAAQSLTISDLRIQHRAPGGRVRGSVAVSPAGAALEVVVRRGARRVGHRTLTTAASARTSFSLRVDRASRARLERVGHLDLRIDATATAPGIQVSAGTVERVAR